MTPDGVVKFLPRFKIRFQADQGELVEGSPPGLQFPAAFPGYLHEGEVGRVRQEIIVTECKGPPSAGSVKRMPGLIEDDTVCLSIGRDTAALDGVAAVAAMDTPELFRLQKRDQRHTERLEILAFARGNDERKDRLAKMKERESVTVEFLQVMGSLPDMRK